MINAEMKSLYYKGLTTILFLYLSVFISLTVSAQKTMTPEITDMVWDKGFGVRIKFSNDSNFVFNVNELYHTRSKAPSSDNEVVYYPVGFGQTFIDQLKAKELRDTSITEQAKPKYMTLWSSLHYRLGGGYIHFINCLLYAFETGSLKLDAPLMKRPESKWKPKPMTESYKRTRKWEYYAPTRQKDAIKEYRIKEKNGELKDLQGVPGEFISLFLTTNDREYQKLVQEPRFKDKAKIDLVRLLIASNYLGEVQINYISNSVIAAVTRYAINQLPTVIIFDDLNAAVAMTLDEKGYQIEKIVFRDYETLDEREETERKEKIYAVIHNINEINQQVFQKSLQNYYRP
ncbi:MAG TPA: hypothetical protein PK990_10440 [Salinivirgaceae bacterium]|nr:hypothetical protein [Salinivirgaceae bacterium]